MTLLLTSVAFKLVTSEWVPQISYQTLLDYYNVICIIVLMAIVLENFIISLLVTYDTIPYDLADKRDELFFEALLTFWGTFNLVIYIGFRFKLFFPHWEQVVRRDMNDEAQQCLRVPKLTGNVRDETIDSTVYGLGNKHHLLNPDQNGLVWDTKTKTFKKKALPGGGSKNESSVQMKEL